MAADAETHADVPGAAAPADWRDLRLAGFDELAAAFDAGTAPTAGELDGAYHGRVLAVAGTDRMPTALRRVLDLAYGAPSPLMPWVGKRFDAGGDDRVGANIWLTNAGPHFASYRILLDEGTCVLDYDVAANPPPLRRIRGEVVRLAPGLYLGRMALRLPESSPVLLYFALETE